MKQVATGLMTSALGLSFACGAVNDDVNPSEASSGAAGTAGAAGMDDAAGTGGGSAAAAIDATESCGEGAFFEGDFCPPSGFPFVRVSFPVTEWCGGLGPVGECLAEPPPGATTVSMSQPEAGAICLSGRFAANGGAAFFALNFSVFNRDATRILETFDADALGITQVGFTIDGPPTGGIIVGANTVARLDCPDPFLGCVQFGWDLPAITEPGRIIAPFSDFVGRFASFADVVPFDTRVLNGMAIGPPGGIEEDYDFCVSDFQFLDAEGNEVVPDDGG